MEDGEFDVLLKPFSLEALEGALDRRMDKALAAPIHGILQVATPSSVIGSGEPVEPTSAQLRGWSRLLPADIHADISPRPPARAKRWRPF